MPKYAMVVDQRRCVACMACVVACKAENEVPPKCYRTRVVEKVEGQYPDLVMELRSELCNHCDFPPCVDNCPTRASYKRADGLVLLDRRKCVGCKACIAACPYDARYIHPEKGYADKCTFCAQRLQEGREPACVSTCIGGSRIFGDLDDPGSGVARALRLNHAEVLLESAGTGPRVFYIRKFGRPL